VSAQARLQYSSASPAAGAQAKSRGRRPPLAAVLAGADRGGHLRFQLDQLCRCAPRLVQCSAETAKDGDAHGVGFERTHVHKLIHAGID